MTQEIQFRIGFRFLLFWDERDVWDAQLLSLAYFVFSFSVLVCQVQLPIVVRRRQQSRPS